MAATSTPSPANDETKALKNALAFNSHNKYIRLTALLTKSWAGRAAYCARWDPICEPWPVFHPVRSVRLNKHSPTAATYS
jgi:hypothetical protein